MTHTTDQDKRTQSLSAREKFMFMLICWGVNPWSTAAKFKEHGFDQKHEEAKQAMYTGLIIYIMSITTFVIYLMVT